MLVVPLSALMNGFVLVFALHKCYCCNDRASFLLVPTAGRRDPLFRLSDSQLSDSYLFMVAKNFCD